MAGRRADDFEARFPVFRHVTLVLSTTPQQKLGKPASKATRQVLIASAFSDELLGPGTNVAVPRFVVKLKDIPM